MTKGKPTTGNVVLQSQQLLEEAPEHSQSWLQQAPKWSLKPAVQKPNCSIELPDVLKAAWLFLQWSKHDLYQGLSFLSFSNLL